MTRAAASPSPASAVAAPPDFTALYERYFPQLMRYLERCLTPGDPAEAADLAQETLIRAWRSWSRFTYRGDAALNEWLYRIAKNLFRDRCRRRAVRSLGTFTPFSEASDIPSTDPLDDPEGHLLRAEQHAAILGHLRVLTPAERAAFTACDIDGLTLAEAARRAGTTRNACKTALCRARQVIARRLGGRRRIRRLTPERRDLILSYRGELSLGHVASLVGVSRQTVLNVWSTGNSEQGVAA